MPAITGPHLNRSAPPVIAAAVVIAAVIAGCSSTPATTEDDATAATVVAAPGGTAAARDPEATPSVSYFLPTGDSFTAALEYMGDGSFVMLNLFRLRDVPDFSKHPEMEPDTPMSSRELFYRYIAENDLLLDRVGAKRVFLADSGPLLIGPDGERWDVVQIVEYPSKQSFLDLAALVRPDVLRREVMLVDSRIMPMHAQPLDVPSAPE